MSIVYIEVQFQQFEFCVFLQPQILDVVECQSTVTHVRYPWCRSASVVEGMKMKLVQVNGSGSTAVRR